MSNTDSEGRAGRRGSRRSRPSRRRRDDGRGARPNHDNDDYGTPHAESSEDEDYSAPEGDGSADNASVSRSTSGRLDKKGAATNKRGAAGRSRRGDDSSSGGSRRASSSGGLDPLSKFSASALRRVSVLGDRPSQVVNSLAEQSQRKRGSIVLGALLSLSGVALLVLLGVLGYQLIYLPSGGHTEGTTAIVEPPDGHSTLVPELYQGEQESGQLFEPIEERPDGAKPLSEKKVFDSGAKKLELDDLTMKLADSDVTDTCTAAAWGDDLQQSLADGTCTSAARGVYQDKKKDYVAQFTLLDLTDSDAASEAAGALDPTNQDSGAGFVLPLNNDTDGLHEGYSQATSQVMGHYLAVFWVARADGAEPKDDDSLAKVNVLSMDAAVSVYRELRDAKESQD